MSVRECFGSMEEMEVELEGGRVGSAWSVRPIAGCLRCELFDRCHQVTVVSILQDVSLYLRELGRQSRRTERQGG